MSVTEEVGYSQFYIGGEWVAPASSDTIEVINPATEAPVGHVPAGNREDIDRAVAAARRAFDETDWPYLEHAERIAILRKLVAGYMARSDQFANLITDEMGCPISTSKWLQAGSPIGLLQGYIDAAEDYPFTEIRPSEHGTGYLVREAVGVVAAIVPWNSPQASAMFKIPPALITGCTVVLKPDPKTPIDAFVLAEMCEEAGVPPGVINIVPADRATSEYLVSHPGVDKVAFTGSTAAGRRIASICGNDLRRVTLELGGKSAALLFEDADLDTAVEALRMNSLMNSGQVCSNKTRILVSENVHDEVVDRLVALMDSMPVGDPHNPETQVGPMVSSAQRDRVEGYIKLGKEEGATITRGGARPKDLDRGWFVDPTLITNVDNSMRVAQEEIFGPVLTVSTFKDEKDAIRLANDSIYGLSGSVFTSDLDRGLRVARRMRTGGIDINGSPAGIGMPFGGFKASGLGREGGSEAFKSYLEPKSIGLPAELVTKIAG